ncbi:uncharacterized mitochondrial protein AtMg00240-like [Nicotiana sylvestris]|uniref:uncharacterized mitochondrial protein AtMg00240-like n=1 Tax=Nicotiana sylvestris TaxID=4096 RepID=UPI00388CD9CA
MNSSEVKSKVNYKEFDNHIGEKEDELLKDVASYQRLIGKLLYLTMTRPDISFVVQTLSQFLQQPKKSHMEAALRIVRYIKREPGIYVLLSSKLTTQLNAYCDADWASSPNTKRQ